ncbi:SMI1/KNR4 family protein (plasmid) [Pseudomonas aeruginosa]
MARESKLSEQFTQRCLKASNPEPQSGVAATWWSDLWIPFAANDEGDCICLDLEPAAEGAKGQVIQVWHDDGGRGFSRIV